MTPAQRKPRVVVWGEVLWDQFPDGARLGGAPANVAWHVGQLAREVPVHAMLVSRVGADRLGDEAIAALAPMVDTSLVQRDPVRATGEVSVEIGPGGDARYRLIADRAWEAIEHGPPVQGVLADTAAVVFGTLAQRTEVGLAQWRRFVADLPPGCLRICDPNLRPSASKPGSDEARALDAALAHCDVVKVNDLELTAIGACLGWADPLAVLRARCSVVAVTHGADGSTLYDRDRAYPTAGLRAATGGDNVGCGDAFTAALTVGMLDGWELSRIGLVGGHLGALIAGVRGATPRFDRATIRRLLEDAA